MADSVENGEFWLPSEFLTDYDILADLQNLRKDGLNPTSRADFAFFSQLPYDFGSCGSSSVSSPNESVLGSSETESDEEDVLAGLTRQLPLQEKSQQITSARPNLEKSWVMSGSPQSTLSAVGSWSSRSAVSSHGSPKCPSQVPSPPLTPLDGSNDAWDLIYAAAGQVARLTMNGEDPRRARGLFGPSLRLAAAQDPPRRVKNPSTTFYANHCLTHNLSQPGHQFEHARENQLLKQQCSSIWGTPTRDSLFCRQSHHQVMSQCRAFETSGRNARPLGLPQSAWPPLQVQPPNHRNPPSQHGCPGMKAVSPGGSAAKRASGTGVFIPRRYDNPVESLKKPGCSTAPPPARFVQTANMNSDKMTVPGLPPLQARARFVGASTADYDSVAVPRNWNLGQQRRRSLRLEGVNYHELCLPQEWTY